MKRLILWVTLLISCASLFSQDAYKGQIRVTREHFARQGDQLLIEIDVDYQRVPLRGNESLTLIPILRTPVYIQSLPLIQINGAASHKLYQKSAGSLTNANRESAFLVVSAAPSAPRQFTYKTSVPYKEWMKGCVLFLRTEECDCGDSQAEVFEDKIASILINEQTSAISPAADTDSRILSRVNFLSPVEAANRMHLQSGSFAIPTAATGKNGSKKNSRADDPAHYEIYSRMRDVVNDVLNQSGTELAYVRITGYGAPIGDYSRNDQLAAGKAIRLKNTLLEFRLSGSAPLEVSWVAEDWDSIATLVGNSNMMFRDAVTDIIRNVSLTQGRERMIMEFAGGAPYSFLRDKIFPQVCRVQYEVGYNKPNREGGGKGAVSVQDFYLQALRLPKGSREFNDLIDLAARMYPDNPQMNINAAAIALTQKNTEKARKYLEQYPTLPEAYNNWGVLHLLEGNNEKAEIYLRMAASAGVEQANETLRELW